MTSIDSRVTPQVARAKRNCLTHITQIALSVAHGIVSQFGRGWYQAHIYSLFHFVLMEIGGVSVVKWKAFLHSCATSISRKSSHISAGEILTVLFSEGQSTVKHTCFHLHKLYYEQYNSNCQFLWDVHFIGRKHLWPSLISFDTRKVSCLLE